MPHPECIPSSVLNDLYPSVGPISAAIDQEQVLDPLSCLLDPHVPLQGEQPYPSPFPTPVHDPVNNPIDADITDNPVLQNVTSTSSEEFTITPEDMDRWAQLFEEARIAGPGELPTASMTTPDYSYGLPQLSSPDSYAALGGSINPLHGVQSNQPIDGRCASSGAVTLSDADNLTYGWYNDNINSSNISPLEQSINYHAAIDYLFQHYSESASSTESTVTDHELIRPNIPNWVLALFFQPVPSSIGSCDDAGKQHQCQEWLCTVCHQRIRKADLVFHHLEHVLNLKGWMCRW